MCPCSWLSSFLSRGFLHRFSIVSRLVCERVSTRWVEARTLYIPRAFLQERRTVFYSICEWSGSFAYYSRRRISFNRPRPARSFCSANLPCIRRGFHAARCPRELTKLRVDKNRLLYLSGLSLSFVIAHSRPTPDSLLLVARIGYSDLIAARKRATRKLSRASVRE